MAHATGSPHDTAVGSKTGLIAVLGTGTEVAETAARVRALGYDVLEAGGVSGRLDLSEPDSLDLALIVAADGSAAVVETVRQLKSRHPSSLVVPGLHSCDGPGVVALYRAGAWEVLLGERGLEEIPRILARATEIRRKGRERQRLADRLEQERARVAELRSRYGHDDPFVEVLGASEVIRSVVDTLREVARSDSTVLITGESGTGKGMAARAIHDASARRDGPFVEANCVVYSEGVLHSELFGHEKGAFTGALRQKRGRFELAAGGTIFLDEIGEISPATQLLLLRVLQDQSFERVGGEQTLRSEARVIAATNSDLEAAMEKGSFRRDLYYRLNVIPIHMPPLRHRPEDVPVLASHFLHRLAGSDQSRVREFDSTALDLMASYSWPGNIRELRNVVERLVVLCRGESIRAEDLPRPLRERKGTVGDPADASLERLEKDRIRETLLRSGGNKKRAASILGIHRATLYAKMRRHGIPLNEEANTDGPARFEPEPDPSR